MYWELRFHFYDIESNHALDILDQNSKMKVRHTEINHIFLRKFQRSVINHKITQSLSRFYLNIDFLVGPKMLELVRPDLKKSSWNSVFVKRNESHHEMPLLRVS